MLLYNIWLEVTSAAFGIILIIFYKVQYKTRLAINQRFEELSWCVFALTVTDVVSAVTISYHASVPIWVNYLFNGSNYLFMGATVFTFINYVRTMVGRTDTIVKKIEKISLIVFTVSEVVNVFTGFFFSFDETGYVHGSLYLIPNIYSYLFIVDAAVLLIRNRKVLTIRKVIGTSSYIVLMLVVAGLQMLVIPEVLLTGFASTLSLFIVFLLMETPDYYKLIATMEELDQARTRANEANKTKSMFLANMSHEIRTPLNAVLGMDEMILRESDKPEITEYAREIKNSGKALLGIINDILDFSKIESGAMTIVPTDYTVVDIVKNIHLMLRERAQQKGLELNINVDENIPKLLYGDEGRISQVLTNLMTNAVKYTNEGSVTLTVSTTLSENSDKAVLRMSVADTGIGIKDEDRAKLFEEFERVDLVRNRTIEGTGLGLAIVSRLVRQMEGTIRVDSVYGEGSVFTVELPQIVKDIQPLGTFDIDSAEVSTDAYEHNLYIPGLHILAVDDNSVNLTVIKNLLKDTGIKITCVCSGAEALKCIEKRKYGIVLLDHMMPGMDGIETLNRAKEIEKVTENKSKYVALTANAVGGAKEMYMEAGFDAYIAKPINSEELEKTIETLYNDGKNDDNQ